ncbi:MAG: TauD/TfdA family dioxygenase [Trebonia sp.]
MAIEWIHEPGAPATVVVGGPPEPGTAADWIREHANELRAALLTHGAVFLRGLPVRALADFAAVRDSLFGRRARYEEKATPRSAFGDDIFSSTDLPSAHAIRLHNENSYTLTFPGLLLFGCLVAPGEGGATPVADVREVLAHLPADLLDRFRRHGWLLSRNYGEDISLDWRTAFATDSRAEVLAYCGANGIDAAWIDDDTLRTSQLRSATLRHPVTGEEAWFNHVAFWSRWSLAPGIREVLLSEFGPDGLPFDTALGDGTALTPEDIAVINTAYERATVRRRWQPGDLLLVDNILAAHGRDPYRGDRQVVVAMGEPQSRATSATPAC